ncbi:MAG: hypothetical protein GAK34_02967 [Delftia tsuruhatensis]|nr:MAG: hypothetical protein GAK34_02967 [Delftia tsuruhatensis]
MNIQKHSVWLAGLLLAVATLSGCASSGLSRSQVNTGIGAVAGGVVGNVLLGGPVATVGGAAIGAVIGSRAK